MIEQPKYELSADFKRALEVVVLEHIKECLEMARFEIGMVQSMTQQISMNAVQAQQLAMSKVQGDYGESLGVREI